MQMNEYSQQEEERENLSGSDDFEAYMHEQEKMKEVENHE